MIHELAQSAEIEIDDKYGPQFLLTSVKQIAKQRLEVRRADLEMGDDVAIMLKQKIELEAAITAINGLEAKLAAFTQTPGYRSATKDQNRLDVKSALSAAEEKIKDATSKKRKRDENNDGDAGASKN